LLDDKDPELIPYAVEHAQLSEEEKWYEQELDLLRESSQHRYHATGIHEEIVNNELNISCHPEESYLFYPS
jgi:hypothetical protein